VAAIGVVVLLAWTLDIPLIERISPAWPRIAPIVGLCGIFLGLSIFVDGRKPALSQSLAAVCALLSLSSRVLHLLEIHFDIDRLGFRTGTAAMSAASSLGLLSLGVALLLPYRRPLRVPYQGLALFATLLAWLGLSRYIVGGEALVPYSRMAFLTPWLILLGSVGVLALRPEIGLMSLLGSAGPGGRLARLLVPFSLIVPIAYGSLLLQGEYAGWYGREAGASIFALATIVTFGALIWINAARLARSEGRREKAELEREQFVALVEQSDDFIAVAHLDGVLSYLNPRGRHLVNAEVAARPLSDFVTEEWREKIHSDAVGAAAKGDNWSGEIRLRNFTGDRVVDVSAHLFPLRAGGTGEPSALAAVMRDVTQRKLGEARLQAQLGRMDLLGRITRAIGDRQDLKSIFRVVLQTLADSFQIDFACGCLYESEQERLSVTSVACPNPAIATPLDISEVSVIQADENGLLRCVRGQLVYEADVEDSPAAFPQRLKQAGLHSFVAAPLLFESKVFGVLIAARGEAGAFTSGDCEFLRQLSEHVALAAGQAQMFDSLQKAYEDLRNTQSMVLQQERLSALGQMASGIAHDINNAISPILLYTDTLMLREAGLSEQGREDMKTIERAIQDVAHTVARMREFHQREKDHWQPEPLQVHVLARHVIDSTRARWRDMTQQRGIEVQMRLELAEIPLIMGAESEIRDALTNLIFNAVDAMPEGGTLTVRTGVIGERPSVEVQDTGVGMDEKTRARCLEPFFTTKGERGTGLGLAMVYGMVERHGGSIEIESEPGLGTIFRLLFSPYAASPEIQFASVAPVRKKARPLRILVVDDDPLVRRAMGEALGSDGHLVTLADGGQGGIDAFHESVSFGNVFELVITDLGMPRVDGKQVAASIKHASPKTPIFLLTGWGQRLVSEQGSVPNVDLVLSKPPRLADLRRAIGTLDIY
jgi:PAS domain S-box-containing protein